MRDTDTIELKNIDPEDISDVLAKVQNAFGFKFGDNELKEVKTFGELCGIITNKVQGDNVNDCTTQQAFYKLRSALAKTTSKGQKEIVPQSDLLNLLPRSTRRQQITIVNSELGLKTNILRAKHWVTATFVLIFIISLLGLFASWQMGLIGIILSLIGHVVANKFANELDLKTVGQLANKLSREHYLKVRSKAGTMNKTEITDIVTDLFCHDLDLDRSVLTNEAVFV